MTRIVILAALLATAGCTTPDPLPPPATLDYVYSHSFGPAWEPSLGPWRSLDETAMQIQTFDQ